MASDSQPEQGTTRRPWACLVGFLAACAVTLMGIVRGFDPDVILQRAAQAALLSGLCFAGVRAAFLALTENAPQ